jgi:tetratricopeptide (TPR) repeat protein
VLLAAGLLVVSPALAAPPPADDEEAPATVSHPVVEPTAPSAGKALNAALGRLARDPRNVDALIEAGNAALALGDNEAALGFFTRADQIAPANAGVKAAIAGARLHLDDPVEALRWYAEAERTAANPSSFALDRGLAFDLVGDNAASIAQYRLVLAHSSDAATRDEATRREALSLAIGGDRRAADLALLPLLQRQDRAAWRAHIFVLAIAGRAEEAVSVAHATMPPELADQIAPYLRFMVRLTPAQQAAVASLGRFPRAADIGRDDPRVASYAAAHPRMPLVPAAEPVAAKAVVPAPDAKTANARRRRGQVAAAAAPATALAKPGAEPEIALPAPPPPVMPLAPSMVATGPTPPPSAGHLPVVVAQATPPAAPVASRSTTTARPGFDLGQLSGSHVAATPPPVAVRTSPGAQATAPHIPQPAVLSRLDMPPPPRRTTTTALAPAGTAVMPTAVTAAPTALAQTASAGGELPPLPVAGASSPTQALPLANTTTPVAVTAAASATPGIASVPVPASTTAAAAATPAQHAVVEPVPAAVSSPQGDAAKAELQAREQAARGKALRDQAAREKAARERAAAERAAREKVAAEKAAAEKVAREKAEDEKAEKAAKTRTGKGHAKAGSEKSGQDEADEAASKDRTDKVKGKIVARDADSPESALAPCKPATTAKGRKGKSASDKRGEEKATRTRSGHGAKGRKHATEDETCAPTAREDRPDGPGGVSRDSDSDDTRTTKSKGKARDKEATRESAAKDSGAKESGRETEKGGRKARYASRIWVQVLTGGDRDKMAGEWRAMVRKAHGLKGHKPYLTPWHSNFRLLTGPFDSDADAQAFIAELRKDGVSGFEWTSPAGQAIDGLSP